MSATHEEVDRQIVTMSIQYLRSCAAPSNGLNVERRGLGSVVENDDYFCYLPVIVIPLIISKDQNWTRLREI